MPATIERHAPATPDHRPSDEDLKNLVYGADTTPDDEPDEILYPGNWMTTRAERELAAKALRKRTHLPEDYAAKNLARAEAMLRLRLEHMGASEHSTAVRDAVATHSVGLPKLQLEAAHDEPAPTEWADAETSHLPAQQEKKSEYTGRHRMRFPLHSFVRHHAPRHSAQ